MEEMEATVLGDSVEQALATVGISQEKVERLLGRPCHCEEHRDMLNSLDVWARRVISGKLDMAREYLERILGSDI